MKRAGAYTHKWALTLFAYACLIPAAWGHDWFPNLVSGFQSVFIDASLIPSPATAAIFGTAQGPDYGDLFLPLTGEPIGPGRAYLVELRLIRDRHIDGVYPSVSMFGESIRLSDFWAAGKPQKFSLFFKAPTRDLTDADRRLAIRIPRGDYRLAIEDVRVREFGIVPLWPGRGEHFTGGLTKTGSPTDAVTQAASTVPQSSSNIDFYWQMPETDRLLEVRLVLRPVEAGGNRAAQTVPLAFSTTNTDE